jgi:hypothetical protein
MKKRLRKKLHKGEFQQFGISIMVPVNENDIQAKLDAIIDVAEQNNILFNGGGLGLFTLPSKEYGNMDVPKKIETLIKFIALSNEPQPDCIIGYFIKPFEKEINNDVALKVKYELEKALDTEIKVNLKIDLWN